MEREHSHIGHIAEPFPRVYELALSRRAFLYILPDGRGGFCSAFRDEKIKGVGAPPSSEVMALRKYLSGALLCRFHEGRGAVVFSARIAGIEAEEGGASDDDAAARASADADVRNFNGEFSDRREQEPGHEQEIQDEDKHIGNFNIESPYRRGYTAEHGQERQNEAALSGNFNIEFLDKQNHSQNHEQAHAPEASVGEQSPPPAAAAEEAYCSFSRHAAPALLVRGKQILGHGAPLPSLSPEDMPEYEAGKSDAALQNYFCFCRKRVLQQLSGLLKKQHTLMEQLRLDQQTYAGHEEISRGGELLKSQLWLVRRGMKEVALTDYFACTPCTPYTAGPQENAEDAEDAGEAPATQNQRTIILDPLLSPQENVAKIFARAAKYRRGLSALEKRLHEIAAALGELEKTRAAVEDITYPDFAILLPHFLRATQSSRGPQGPQGARSAQKSSRPGAPAGAGQREEKRRSLPYRVFEKENTIIWAGKDAKGNALISLKLAAGNDLWFHAKNYPGSHVVLRRRRKSHIFTEREVYDAALLALHYSEARVYGREEVLYTEAKHIRAVPGARTGTVHAAASRSLTVTLDDERLAEAKRAHGGML